MFFNARRWLATAFVLFLLIQMHVTESGYAVGKPKIAFSSTRDGNHEIYIMDGDGENQVRLTDDPANDSNPSWSPDGVKIAFTHGKGEDIDIYVMDTDGGNQKQLTQIGWNYQPAWSPDGERIAYVTSRRHGGPEIYAMDEDGNNEVRLTRDLLLKKRPSWSPDGQRIAYDAMHRGAVFQIYVVKADGSGRIKRLTRNVPAKWSPAWSLDGNSIAYAAAVPFNQSTIHLMTADGDYLKQLSVFKDGVESDPDWFEPPAWSVSPAANFATIWGEIKTPKSARR